MVLTHIDLKYISLIYRKIHQKRPNGKGLIRVSLLSLIWDLHMLCLLRPIHFSNFYFYFIQDFLGTLSICSRHFTMTEFNGYQALFLYAFHFLA